jgi:hypothetical protein
MADIVREMLISHDASETRVIAVVVVLSLGSAFAVSAAWRETARGATRRRLGASGTRRAPRVRVALPRAVDRLMASRRDRRLEAALPDVLDGVARSLRSGGSLRQAIAEAATGATGALAADLERVANAARDGVPLQPVWLAAHRCHRAEEIQHVATDDNYLRSLPLSAKRRGQLADRFVFSFEKTFAQRLSLTNTVAALRKLHPGLEIAAPSSLRALPVFDAILHDRAFRRTRDHVPTFAKLAGSARKRSTSLPPSPWNG